MTDDCRLCQCLQDLSISFAVMTVVYFSVVGVLSLTRSGSIDKSLLGTKADDLFNLAYLPILCGLSFVASVRLGKARTLVSQGSIAAPASHRMALPFLCGVFWRCVGLHRRELMGGGNLDATLVIGSWFFMWYVPAMCLP